VLKEVSPHLLGRERERGETPAWFLQRDDKTKNSGEKKEELCPTTHPKKERVVRLFSHKEENHKSSHTIYGKKKATLKETGCDIQARPLRRKRATVFFRPKEEGTDLSRISARKKKGENGVGRRRKGDVRRTSL